MNSHKPFIVEKASHRPARFAARVKEELVSLVPGSLRDPRVQGLLFLTITHVEVTPDLKNGSVRFSLMDQDQKRGKEVEAALNQAAGFLRRELMQRLNTKVTPHLLFRFDKGLENSARIETLLHAVAAEEADKPQIPDTKDKSSEE